MFIRSLSFFFVTTLPKLELALFEHCCLRVGLLHSANKIDVLQGYLNFFLSIIVTILKLKILPKLNIFYKGNLYLTEIFLKD